MRATRSLVAALATVTALAAITVSLAGCREREVGLDARAAAPGVTPSPTRLLYPSAPGSFVDLVAGARHGVVAIRAATPVKSGPAAMFPGAPETLADVALGTGFLIEAGGVFVLTNDHIAAASSELRVVLAGGTEVPAKVIGRDVRLDLALLAVDVPRLQALPLGDSDDLQVGEWLVVLGNPFGDEVSAAVGIVSATGRETAGSLVPGRAMGYRTFLQTDARIHRGNAGGPVVDTAGQVIGVAVATSDRPGELSFAIPINRVKEVIVALRDHGQVARSWLGVKVQPVTRERVQSLGLPGEQGALVTDIVAGSPAVRSTLRVGDVILKWGDRSVDHRTLPWLVAQAPIGKPVSVTVWRNRAELTLPVVTEKMPE
ncbi:MAG: trypsin-like peptidase domain-containing protein [Myxococcota bacterium]|nr:trypsin-like peptidase domain-containing protein [Myxococcota bacterium]